GGRSDRVGNPSHPSPRPGWLGFADSGNRRGSLFQQGQAPVVAVDGFRGIHARHTWTIFRAMPTVRPMAPNPSLEYTRTLPQVSRFRPTRDSQPEMITRPTTANRESTYGLETFAALAWYTRGTSTRRTHGSCGRETYCSSRSCSGRRRPSG